VVRDELSCERGEARARYQHKWTIRMLEMRAAAPPSRTGGRGMVKPRPDPSPITHFAPR
jgi:hypothetical protein